MVNEDIIKHELSLNPSYDYDWVCTAASILSKELDGFTEENLKLFNAAQLTQLKAAVDKNVDLAYKLSANTLNATQMQLIILGYDNGVSMEYLEKLIDPSIPFNTLNYIVQAIIDGYTDMIDYINFDADQVCEIYAAHKDEIDYSIFDKKEIDAASMALIRHALNIGFDVSVDEAYNIIIKKESHLENK